MDVCVCLGLHVKRTDRIGLPWSIDQHWTLIRMLNYTNTFSIVACAAIYVSITNETDMTDGAIAEYIIFLNIIIDTGFQMMDIGNNVLEL